jgi:hypothetical protein
MFGAARIGHHEKFQGFSCKSGQARDPRIDGDFPVDIKRVFD